jgi:hypothetical protein
LATHASAIFAKVRKDISIMNEPPDQQSDVQLQFIRKLIEENAAIVGDAVEIRKDRWVVHGVLPYGGEVPMAVFDSYEEAKRALDEILGGEEQAKLAKPKDT